MGNMFICTKDNDTKEILLREGFQLVESNNGCWKFANMPSKDFESKVDSDKISYTNRLCI